MLSCPTLEYENEQLCQVWTPDSGLLTEALKLKRRPIAKKYEETIERLYARINAA